MPALRSLLFALFSLAATAAPGAGRRPDIVVFLTDDQSQLDCSAYGSKDVRTPNMQRLADAGLTFDNAFVASPSCAPSRAAMLTGLAPARNGAEANHEQPRADVKKWPAYFQELGYEVVAFGKVAHYKQTHLYGFDYFAHDTFHDHECIPAAVEYLKNRDRESTRPLCLMVGSNYPHVPWPDNADAYTTEGLHLPASTIDTSTTRDFRRHYLAAVEIADHDLGVIYDAAQALLPKDTIFMFSADHGAQWPFAKWNCYDAGIRVPLMVSWPGVVKPHTRTDAIVSWLDFMPTLLELVGGKAPEGIDGRSFAGVVRGTTSSHRDRIYTTHTGDGTWNIYPMRSLRADGWKYILNLHPEYAFTCHIDLSGELTQREMFVTWEQAAQTSTTAKEIVNRYHARPAEELYDLSKDPNEEHNVASNPANKSRLEAMRHEVRETMRQQGDKERTLAKPRLLSDPTAYGPGAGRGDAKR